MFKNSSYPKVRVLNLKASISIAPTSTTKKNNYNSTT
jgi:hypothetical protein